MIFFIFEIKPIKEIQPIYFLRSIFISGSGFTLHYIEPEIDPEPYPFGFGAKSASIACSIQLTINTSKQTTAPKSTVHCIAYPFVFLLDVDVRLCHDTYRMNSLFYIVNVCITFNMINVI